MARHTRAARSEPPISPEGLLCALIVAPHAFSRNRFPELYEDPGIKRVRGRAKRIRGIIRQLAQQGAERPEIIGRHELDDGRVLLRYRIPNLAFARTTSLSALEAAAVSYALSRLGLAEYTPHDRRRLEGALRALGVELPRGIPAPRS